MAKKETKLSDAQNICITALNAAVDKKDLCRGEADKVISKCKGRVK
jgi:hypothetical protein